MDFQSVNPLNVRLNMISGNLMPMTANVDSSFPILWKMYSALVWLLQILEACVLIPGCMFVPKEKALKDGLIALIITIEATIMVTRIHARRELVQKIIEKLNDVLRIEDEMMKEIVMETLKPIEIPLKFYWMAGVVSIIMWSCTPLALVFQKNSFYYVDYRMPVAYAKEPLSTGIFILGSLVVLISSMYIFTKKVSVDSYIINMMLLLTAQYKYIALKLSMIFQDRTQQSSCNKREHYSKTNCCAEKKIKTLCRHYNTVFHITLMFSELVSLTFSLIYVNSVFRFCGIAIMMISIPSTSLLEGCLIVMYASGGVVQLYILCSCVQQLLDASIVITDQAFHEGWYEYGTSAKRTFMFLIMANNLELKLSTFGKYNLSLPSFIAILNQSYSIALLLLKIQ